MKENKSPLLSPNWIHSISRMLTDWKTCHVNEPRYLCLDVAAWKSLRAHMENIGLSIGKSQVFHTIGYLGLEIVVVPGASGLCVIAGTPDVELKIEEIRLERKYRQENNDT